MLENAAESHTLDAPR